jgi:hypothetical protein
MRYSDLMCGLLLGVAFTTSLPGQVDAREIIRRAVAADELNWKAASNYMFLQRLELDQCPDSLSNRNPRPRAVPIREGKFSVSIARPPGRVRRALLRIRYCAWDGSKSIWCPSRERKNERRRPK